MCSPGKRVRISQNQRVLPYDCLVTLNLGHETHRKVVRNPVLVTLDGFKKSLSWASSKFPLFGCIFVQRRSQSSSSESISSFSHWCSIQGAPRRPVDGLMGPQGLPVDCAASETRFEPFPTLRDSISDLFSLAESRPAELPLDETPN